MKKKVKRKTWVDRARLYAGGALMILAPVGVAACNSGKSGPSADVAPTDTEIKDILYREAIAIAPLKDLLTDVNGRMDLVTPDTVQPADTAPDSLPEVIAIAPLDTSLPDTLADAPPEIIAIAPADTFQPDGPLLIAPADVGSHDMWGEACFPEGSWCNKVLNCQAQAMCIIATECCGGCKCVPIPCNPQNPWCPDGSSCVPTEGGQGQCELDAE